MRMADEVRQQHRLGELGVVPDGLSCSQNPLSQEVELRPPVTTALDQLQPIHVAFDLALRMN